MADQNPDGKSNFESEALVHLDTLYNVALRLAGSAADAEDLVQETVLKAYRSWDKYQPGTNCRAWLVTILRNTFINQFRKQSKKPATVQPISQRRTAGAGTLPNSLKALPPSQTQQHPQRPG